MNKCKIYETKKEIDYNLFKLLRFYTKKIE